VNADDDLVEAWRSLSSNDYNPIPGMAEGKFVGLLSRADVVRYLQTRKELGIDKRPL
jgi:CBS domain-containing protein